jgi:RNA polymerase sigma factor (TIGR02999 family)
MRRERAGHTLQATALVNEFFLRLDGGAGIEWESRAHFFGVAAQAMRQILVEHARGRGRLKRGGGVTHLTLGENVDWSDEKALELVALDDALKGLEKFAPRQSRIIEMRFFGGLSVEEAAAALGVSAVTVKREWRAARTWLYREIGGKELK